MSEPRAPSMWTLAGLVFLGGGIGAVARSSMAVAVASLSGHPAIFTLTAINLIGGVVAGATVACWPRADQRFARRHAFLVPGVCGGFTSFSSLGLQGSSLVQGGHVDTAIVGLVLGLLIGLGAGTLGRRLVGRRLP